MKKQLLLIPIVAGISWLALTGYSNGPFAGGAGNHTGSAGSTANCSTGGGCHNTNTSSTTGGIGVTTLTNGIVTKYTPGTTYKVVITAANTTASLPKCGFQASCVKASATSTQAGSFTSTASNISVVPFGSLQFVEHNKSIAAAVSSGNNNTYQVSFNWTAPPAGTGMVRFYATFNAVNGNTTSSGDQPNNLPTYDLDEAASATGVATVKPGALAVYPNPATDALHLKLSGTGSCLVRIFDITGGSIAVESAAVVNGEASVGVAALKPGNYYILAEQGGIRYGALFQKQ